MGHSKSKFQIRNLLHISNIKIDQKKKKKTCRFIFFNLNILHLEKFHNR